MAWEPYVKSKITIVPEESKVSVDGVAIWPIDCSELPEWIHAIQWDGQAGHIEFKPDSKGQRHPNILIFDLAGYHFLIDRWDVQRDVDERAIKDATAQAQAEDQKQRTQAALDAKTFLDRRHAEHESWKKHKSKLDPAIAAAIEAACVAHGGRLPE